MAAAIWSVADLLRGDYKRHEYGGVILPFTLLRRLDATMAPTREKVRDRAEKFSEVQKKDLLLRKASGVPYYNVSDQDFASVAGDSGNVAKNLRDYVSGFSPDVQRILGNFEFDAVITRLVGNRLLYKVVARFQEMTDLEKLSNHDMGYVFEHLIRKFAEDSNETAGEHFTPREVIRLMVRLLLDSESLAGEGQVVNILDPACGTGGMLAAADDAIKEVNPNAEVYLFGQEVNAESWAVCQSDMLMSNRRGEIAHGNSFSHDAYGGRTFDYMLANPPFGVEWKKIKNEVDAEAELGFAGRFGAGLPRINDGSFLFLQHMISKMERSEERGSRLAIVFNGSPLFTGAAGSGESRIRQWILENDYLEGIVALPDQLFYNTGISTYFWILANRKSEALKDRVILLDARDQWVKMRKSLGDKRKEISEEQIAHIASVYDDAVAIAADADHPDHDKVKVFRTRDFGYHRITVERPLRQRFEITDETLAALKVAKPLARWEPRDAFVDALRPLLGQVWWTKNDALTALRAAAKEVGVLWPSSAPVQKAIWGAVAVSDSNGELQKFKGAPLPDADLRDYENVPLHEDIDEYFQREVVPHVPDAWIDVAKTKVGYEIPLTRYFFRYQPPRSLVEIDTELKDLEMQIQKLLSEVAR
ncbi:class I SAM-dependent DNA methyltransferase [Actinomycetospora sp. NBRC 106378]|uniref:type I restriction-modification system subunit M n=1 Tax=Actinomycetospora sp. NBRC 106378 TaxID=3032208 RepID=UPI0025525AA4|nr:class I SAM-dependent DNA methyltransferase [Actinomycetospora sp. NBRC 106378]